MSTINDVQLTLQNLLKRTVSQSEIGKALGTGRSNINLRIKNNSEIKIDEIKKLESYFKVSFLKTNNITRDSENLYLKSLKILNAATDDEIEFYYSMLMNAQKCINNIKMKKI